jgi:transposase
MEKTDIRRLSPEKQAVLRGIIIRMKEQKDPAKEIMNTAGGSEAYISQLWGRRKNASGKKAKERIITQDRRGRIKGENRTLSPEQEKKIQKMITAEYPDQLRFDFALRTREAVRQLIQRECGITMPIRTAGEYPARWGYTPQRPVKFSYERNSKEVKQWLEIEYPRIKKRAKRAKGEIYWGDETGVSTGGIRGRGYAPAGKTPAVMRSGKREHISMASAITNRGKILRKIYERSVNGEMFFEFVKRLVKKSRVKVFLIIDNLRTHKSKRLKERVRENKEKTALYYLPAYSPDLNPDEHVNADVKHGAGARTPKKTKKDLRAAAEEHMKMLNKTPQRIMKYFEDAAISYAA